MQTKCDDKHVNGLYMYIRKYIYTLACIYESAGPGHGISFVIPYIRIAPALFPCTLMKVPSCVNDLVNDFFSSMKRGPTVHESK